MNKIFEGLRNLGDRVCAYTQNQYEIENYQIAILWSYLSAFFLVIMVTLTVDGLPLQLFVMVCIGYLLFIRDSLYKQYKTMPPKSRAKSVMLLRDRRDSNNHIEAKIILSLVVFGILFAGDSLNIWFNVFYWLFLTEWPISEALVIDPKDRAKKKALKLSLEGAS